MKTLVASRGLSWVLSSSFCTLPSSQSSPSLPLGIDSYRCAGGPPGVAQHVSSELRPIQLTVPDGTCEVAPCPVFHPLMNGTASLPVARVRNLAASEALPSLGCYSLFMPNHLPRCQAAASGSSSSVQMRKRFASSTHSTAICWELVGLCICDKYPNLYHHHSHPTLRGSKLCSVRPA